MLDLRSSPGARQDRSRGHNALSCVTDHDGPEYPASPGGGPKPHRPEALPEALNALFRSDVRQVATSRRAILDRSNLANLKNKLNYAGTIERHIKQELIDRLGEAPAVALLGPRQVGKTTLAQEVGDIRPSIYLDLESDADRAKLTEPELYLGSHEDKLVILDEAAAKFRGVQETGLVMGQHRPGRNSSLAYRFSLPPPRIAPSMRRRHSPEPLAVPNKI